MRIIGGTHRGRRIQPPEGKLTTRPITDRVKQSLFDRLTSMQMLDGRVLDLFAGTGSLGLEALSRGVESCTFVEIDRSALRGLRANLENLGLAERADVLALDALRGSWLERSGGGPFQVVFCDPPYRLSGGGAASQAVERLIDALAPYREDDGLLVLRAQRESQPPQVTRWEGPETHSYGSMSLHFYRPALDDAP